MLPTLVLPDRALAAIAAADPHDDDALAAIHGVGPLVARRYGRRILDTLGSVGPTERQSSTSTTTGA